MRRKWRARLTLEAIPAITVGVLLYWNVFPLFVELGLLFALFSLVVWTELVLIITGAYANLPKSWEWKVEKQVKTLNSIPTVGWFFEAISNRVEKHRTVANRQEQYDTANRIINDYVEIVGDELDRELEFSLEKRAELVERIVADTEQRKVNAYPILTEELLNGAFDKNRKAVEAVIFAVEQERLDSSDRDLSYTGEQLSNFRQGVANAFEQLDFSGGGQAKCNLTALYVEHWSATPQGDGLDEMTDAQVYEAFVGQYYPHKEYPAYESGEEEVDYKSEIVRLVQSELSIGNVQTDLLERLQTERERIKSHVRSHEAYFVCAKKIGGDASFYDEFEEKFPRRIRIGNKYINEPTRDEEPLEIWMRIVFPEETYGSAENFREQALADIISDGVMVFVSEVNLPFETHRSEDELTVIADEPENVRYVLTETDLLLTGHSEEEITQRALDNLAVVNEDVEKILAALSLRSLVPNATSKEEAVFERNRTIVEEDLGITQIFDWRTRDVDKVSAALRDVDEENVSDRWEEIARHLIQRVDAATPPEYKEGNQAEARLEPTD